MLWTQSCQEYFKVTGNKNRLKPHVLNIEYPNSAHEHNDKTGKTMSTIQSKYTENVQSKSPIKRYLIFDHCRTSKMMTVWTKCVVI